MPAKNIAVDIGTNSIKAFSQGQGVIFSQANAVAYDSQTDEIIAIGDSAFEMLEKNPDSIYVKTPVRGGVIYDYNAIETILSYMIEKLSSGEFYKPNFIVCVPSSCTDIQKKTITDIFCLSGAGKVSVIEEPVASAYGCALDVDRPFGTLVVDIGAGTTDIAVISMGTVASSSTLALGGNDIDEAIVQFIRFEKKVQISRKTAERIKKMIGCAVVGNEEVEISFSGKDVVSEMPKLCTVNSSEICGAVNQILRQIMIEISATMEQIPVQMYIDICSSGIVLTGGSSRLKNISRLFSDYFQSPVSVCEDAENTAIKGAGFILQRIDQFEDLGFIFKIRHQSRFIS